MHFSGVASGTKPDGITVAPEEPMADRRDLHRDGTENRIEGAAEELEGKIRGGVGDAVDDHDEHLKGRAKEMKGKVKKKFGEVQQDIANRDRDRDR